MQTIHELYKVEFSDGVKGALGIDERGQLYWSGRPSSRNRGCRCLVDQFSLSSRPVPVGHRGRRCLGLYQSSA